VSFARGVSGAPRRRRWDVLIFRDALVFLPVACGIDGRRPRRAVGCAPPCPAAPLTLVGAFAYTAWVALSVFLLALALLCYAHGFARQVGAEYNPVVVAANGSTHDSWSVWSYRDGVMFCHSWTRLKIPCRFGDGRARRAADVPDSGRGTRPRSLAKLLVKADWQADVGE
jgi:hypothetical protein